MNSANEPPSAGESGISLLTGFARGFAAPLDGLLFMRKHPALWQYGLMPMVINLVISGIVMLAAAYGVWYAAGQLEGVFPEGWLGQVGYYASLIGLVLLAVMLAFGFWILMQGLLCGVYYEKLTRRIEEILDSDTSQFDDLPFTRGMLDAARDAGSLVTTTVGLQFLHIIPVLGLIAALGLTLYFDSFILGREYFDYPLSLRGLDRAQKKAFVKAHRGHTLGMGAAVMALMTVPVLGAVLLTSAVAGAVLLHRKLIDGRVKEVTTKARRHEGRKAAVSHYIRVLLPSLISVPSW